MVAMLVHNVTQLCSKLVSGPMRAHDAQLCEETPRLSPVTWMHEQNTLHASPLLMLLLPLPLPTLRILTGLSQQSTLLGCLSPLLTLINWGGLCVAAASVSQC